MKLQPDIIDHGATFSPCGRYRFTLWRAWDFSKPTVCFVGLNPSTATEDTDDQTIRRCITISRGWGFGRYVMLNAFGWRDRNPDALIGHPDPIGIGNDEAIASEAAKANRVVLAWGRFQKLRVQLDVRTFFLKRLLREHAKEVGHLGLNADGSFKHPLFLKGTTAFVPMELR